MKIKEIKDISLLAVSFFVSIGFLLIVIFLLLKAVPSENKDLLNVLLGAFATCFIGIVQYWIGSSKGSADKTEMMNDKFNNLL